MPTGPWCGWRPWTPPARRLEPGTFDRPRGLPGVAAGASRPVEREEPPEQRTVVVLPVSSTQPARTRTLVPGVAGGSIRRAANALHRRGFRVAVYGHGKVTRTTPADGDSASVGSLESLWAE